MSGDSDLQTRDIAHKLRGEVHQRLAWYDKALSAALTYFAFVNGGGLVTTVVFTGFLIQFHRPVGLALAPALLFGAGLIFIGLFHLGHAAVIRNWAKGKFRIHRNDDDEFSFVEAHTVVNRLFSHLHLWPAVLAGLCAIGGIVSGLVAVYG